MSIYKKAINELLLGTKNYREKTIRLDQYQNLIWQTADEIVHVEEKELRYFLQSIEGELELLRFTVDEDMIETFEPSLKIIDRLEARLLKEL